MKRERRDGGGERRRQGGGGGPFRVGEQAVRTLFLIRKQTYFIKVKMEKILHIRTLVKFCNKIMPND